MNQFMQSIAYTKKLECYNKKMSLFHALLVQIQFKYSSLEKNLKIVKWIQKIAKI